MTTEQITRRNELLSKIPGQPTGQKGDPIPEAYQGLSDKEAVELEMLLSGSDHAKASQTVKWARHGKPMDL